MTFSLSTKVNDCVVATLTTRNMMMKTIFLMIMLLIMTLAMGQLQGTTGFKRNTRVEELGLPEGTLLVKEDISMLNVKDTFDNKMEVLKSRVTNAILTFQSNGPISVTYSKQ